MAVMLLTLLGTASCFAAEFSVVRQETSSITFVSKQMGVPVEGRFRKFAAQIVLDPARVAAGSAEVIIDTSTIDAGGAEANEEVKSKSWFNIREFPAARFVASGFRSLGAGRYEAVGRMTIKGVSRDVVATFTAGVERDMLHIRGSIPLLRLQYGIGDGQWADTSTIADDVQVRFDFTLIEAPPARKK